jgi:hypothetical protein
MLDSVVARPQELSSYVLSCYTRAMKDHSITSEPVFFFSDQLQLLLHLQDLISYTRTLNHNIRTPAAQNAKTAHPKPLPAPNDDLTVRH